MESCNFSNSLNTNIWLNNLKSENVILLNNKII